MKNIPSSAESVDTKQRMRVVVVDDEQDFARGLSRLISGRFRDIEVAAAFSGKEALRLMSEHPVHLMITDLRMPEMSGMQLLKEALNIHPEMSMVVLSAYGNVETAVQALHAGAYDFLTKPIEPNQLYRVVEKGLERSRLVEENNRLRRILAQSDIHEEMIGAGPAMQQLRRSIAAIAQSDYPVLIRGESGTGKEVAARLIHRMGSRSAKPFLAVDCPSIPENLLESELFGYVKGSFTGADRDHTGLFAAADSGTIHLDEIGDISQAVQTKLLRCLQSSEVRPIGSNQTFTVDVRVISSTNQDLEAGLRNKTFREDLYYRLNVLSITLPPLRDRIEDIPLLALHFLREICRGTNLPEKEIAPDVVQWMAERSWPGNVRELQNFVRRLTVFCPGERIDMQLVHGVLEGTHQPGLTEIASNTSTSGIAEYKAAKEDVLNSFTRRYVRELLVSTKGNVSEAARISGLSRVALQKILIRLGENAARFRE
jgi:DNA-binding NtrC family response regulator